MLIKYRSIQKNDAESIYLVAKSSWEYTYKNIFKSSFIKDYLDRYYSKEAILEILPKVEAGEQFFYVALDGTKIIGYSNLVPGEEMMELARIYLLPDYIGKGIGAKLIELGEEFMKSKSIDRYFCFVNKGNKIGRRFYEKMGFQNIPGKESLSKEPEWCQWYMEKAL